MRQKTISFFMLTFLVFGIIQAFSVNYFVSPNGNNSSGNGSMSAPWATIQKACDYVAAGDIIYLRGGIYNHRDYIDANVDGTATNPITIMNYNGEEVIFDGTGVSLGDNAGLIFFANWDSNPTMEYYVLDGITVRNSTERGISFYKTDHLVIKNCLVHDIEKRAIGGFGHYITIENNEIYNAALENEYGAMGNSGWAMTCYTTTDYENGDPSTNVTIRNNYIHNCWGEGIGPGQGSDQVLIEGNTVRDVWSVGIYADKATNATIKNNHIYNTDPTYFRNGAPAVGISMANEISFGNIYNPISNFYIYNNLISNVRKGIGFWFDDSNDESGNSYHNLVIAYNLIYQPTAQGIAIDEIPSGYNQPSGCILKNNIVYLGSSQSTVGDLSAWDISHNDWIGGIPSFGTSASFNTEPGFVNPGISAAPEGFKLSSANASCYGTGVSLAAFTTEDFWHSARSASTPCIGIHEASFSNAPQYYVSSTCTQNAAILTPGETNQMVIGIQIVTTGNTNPLEVYSFTLNASGTTNLADISNAKLFYTGNAGTFNTNNQFGSTVPALTFSDFTIIGSQTLSEYVNYFWLSFDIDAGASIGNLADASCIDISLGTQTYIPTITSPAGATQIGQIAGMEYIDSYGVQISDDVNVGTINAPILQMPVITSGTANPLLVSQIRINAKGTTSIGDVTNARIFYTGNNPEFNDAVQFGNTKTNPATTNFIIAGSQSLMEGTNYFWLSLDVLPGATVGNVIDGQYRKIWIDGTAIDPASKVPAGNRTIVDDTPPPDMELASVGLTQITGLVFPGSVNNEMLQITLETSGTGNPLEVNRIDFSAVGSTSSTDIGNAKVFFTGSSPVFSTGGQFGAGEAIVDFNVVNLSGSQILEEGLNYFWLSFDINENAPGASLIDAECYSLEIGGNIFELDVYNPEGSREVLVPLLENTVQFGFGTNASYKFGPMYRSRADSDYDYSRFSYLYTQAELADAGIVPGSLITKIAWYKTNTANITNNGLAYFDIYMKNSDKTILVNPTNWETGVLDGATLVAEKTYTKTDDPFAVKGWMEIELDQPFVYAGGALEISTDWDISGVTNYPTNGGFNWQWTDVAAGRTIAAAHDYPGGVTDLVYREPYNYYYGDADGSKRPNIQITYSGSSVKGKEISNNVQTPETNISNGDARIYSQNSAVVIEFSELPENDLMVYLFNLNGQIIKSLPLETQKTLIPVNNTHGLVIVKIQGPSYRQVKKEMFN